MATWTCKCLTAETEAVSAAKDTTGVEPLTSSSFHDVDDLSVDVLVDRELRHLRRRAGQGSLESQADYGPEELDQVLEWLCDLCWENSCSPLVFSLAVQLMQAFLQQCQIKASQLQLSAVACLVLASKIRSSKHPHCSIPVSTLVDYADNSFNETDVKVTIAIVSYYC